jgi:hypothetical protein
MWVYIIGYLTWRYWFYAQAVWFGAAVLVVLYLLARLRMWRRNNG